MLEQANAGDASPLDHVRDTNFDFERLSREASQRLRLLLAAVLLAQPIPTVQDDDSGKKSPSTAHTQVYLPRRKEESPLSTDGWTSMPLEEEREKERFVEMQIRSHDTPGMLNRLTKLFSSPVNMTSMSGDFCYPANQRRPRRDSKTRKKKRRKR